MSQNKLADLESELSQADLAISGGARIMSENALSRVVIVMGTSYYDHLAAVYSEPVSFIQNSHINRRMSAVTDLKEHDPGSSTASFECCGGDCYCGCCGFINMYRRSQRRQGLSPVAESTAQGANEYLTPSRRHEASVHDAH